MKQLHFSRAPQKADKPMSPDEFLNTLPSASAPVVAPTSKIEPDPVVDEPKQEADPIKKPAAKKVVQFLPPPILPVATESEPVQRLTLDIPASLHRLIKVTCTSRDTSMKDEIIALLEQYYRPR